MDGSGKTLEKKEINRKNPAIVLGMLAWALAYSVLNQGLSMLALPYEAKRLVPTKASTITGGIAAAGSFCQVFGLIVCFFSDHTTFRWGRRRIFVLSAAILSAGFCVFWVFGDIGNSIVFIAISYILIAASISSGIIVLEALIPDLLPEKQHGMAGGFLGLLQVIGTALGFGLFSAGIPVWSTMIVFGGASAVAVIPTLLCAKEQRFIALETSTTGSELETRGSKFRETLRSFGFPLLKHVDWVLILAIRCCFYLSVGYASYTQYWVADTLQITNAESYVANTGLATLGACVLASLPAGLLSDKIGRKPILISAMSLMLVSLVLMAIARSIALIWVAIILFGVGNGMYPSVEIAIACDCIPRSRDAGKFMAEFAVSLTAGQLVGQLVFGLSLQAFSTGLVPISGSVSSSSGEFIRMYSQTGYTVIFSMAASCSFIGLVLSTLISPTRGKSAQEPDITSTSPVVSVNSSESEEKPAAGV